MTFFGIFFKNWITKRNVDIPQKKLSIYQIGCSGPGPYSVFGSNYLTKKLVSNSMNSSD